MGVDYPDVDQGFTLVSNWSKQQSKLVNTIPLNNPKGILKDISVSESFPKIKHIKEQIPQLILKMPILTKTLTEKIAKVLNSHGLQKGIPSLCNHKQTRVEY